MKTKIKIREFNYNQFFKDNAEMLRLYNNVIYPKIACIGAIVTTIALIGSYFNEYMQRARLPYGIICIFCLAIFFTRKFNFWKKHPVLCDYLVFGLIYAMLLYMSIVLFQNGTGASILVLLTIFPVTFVDRPGNLFLADIGMYVIHTICSFLAKDIVFAGLDMVNGLIATMVGCVFGFFILNSRLHALNYRVLLAVEREVDVLTGLYNRRKMTEEIESFARGFTPEPTGVIMMDIDWFKNYNDTYGHVAGDTCLQIFGQMLKSMESEEKIKPYRYGGEEFVAFVWDADKAEIYGYAERIHAQTKELPIEHKQITLSVGYVYCSDKQVKNFETWIQRADRALYIAKGRGRDCVVDYDELKE